MYVLRWSGLDKKVTERDSKYLTREFKTKEGLFGEKD